MSLHEQYQHMNLHRQAAVPRRLRPVDRDNMIENTKAVLEAVRTRGKKGGRKLVMDSKKLAQAKALRSDPTLLIEDICKTLGISRATLYRYTGDRSK